MKLGSKGMSLWWSLCNLYLHACLVSYCRRLRSWLLRLCDVLQALINSLVCWNLAKFSSGYPSLMCAVGVVIILWYMGNLLLFLCAYLFQVERELSTPGENIKTLCFCVHVSGRAWAYNTWWGWNLRLHVTVAITSAAEAVHHLHADAADRPLPVAGQRPVPGWDGSLDAHWSADLASADSDWPLGPDWISVCVLHLETVLCWWLDLVRVVDSMRGFVTSDWLWRLVRFCCRHWLHRHFWSTSLNSPGFICEHPGVEVPVQVPEACTESNNPVESSKMHSFEVKLCSS